MREYEKVCSESEVDWLLGRLQTLNHAGPDPDLIDSFESTDAGPGLFTVRLFVRTVEGFPEDYPVSGWGLGEGWTLREG
jgi:hypothetical protein